MLIQKKILKIEIGEDDNYHHFIRKEYEMQMYSLPPSTMKLVNECTVYTPYRK